ncbi:MAG: ATP-grasp domain-containing protein [Marinilabiliaceae bacterium]|nr:ATP-grasp domain-containing protein [Marinilabiliaceae bacterium]
MDFREKKILLLGGSAQQLVAIRAAKELGLYTILCDYLPDNPGQYEVDKFYQLSTTDVEAVYKVAREERVNGILAYASDPAALPAAIVADRLGLPTNPVTSVEILGIKNKFRDFLEQQGFACPKHVDFHPSIPIEELKERVAHFHFPIIIKPTDSSGSKGVTKLDKDGDFEKAISWADSYSRNKVLIAEEFIYRGFPNVIGGDIFVDEGKIVLYGEMSCLRDNDGKGLVPIGKMLPSGLNMNQIDIVHKELQRLVSTLQIKGGQMNIEIILDEKDTPHFLELGPRAGGNMIPIQLSDAYNVDLVKANVLVAMGEKADIKPSIPEGCYMHYVLHSFQYGKFAGIEIDMNIEKFVYRQVIYKKYDDIVEYFDGAGKAVGIIFLHFDNAEQMRDFCEHHHSYVKINLK